MSDCKSDQQNACLFNRPDAVATGWYWLLPSNSLKRREVKAVEICGYELAVFRGENGRVSALDAYCPHMGAHLAEGNVEGNELRCFFHRWRFDEHGVCTEIPCLKKPLRRHVQTNSWHVAEQCGFIWVWLGEGEPEFDPPFPPELDKKAYETLVGKRFFKRCHPNVVMINAIDEQHFRSVHLLPGELLSMEPKELESHHMRFHNTGSPPARGIIGRLFAKFYAGPMTYELDYFSGSTGIVTLGPDKLHMYLMFALRPTSNGGTEGYAISLAKRRSGLLGSLVTRFILLVSYIAGQYFSIGDTRVFQTIRFNLKTPIADDRAILSFMRHLEKQKPFPTAYRYPCNVGATCPPQNPQ